MRKAVRAIIVKDGKLLVMHRNKFGQQYYTLVGGAIDMGEEAEQALAREVREESGLTVTKQQLVFTEAAGDPFGTQYIYWCEAEGGDIYLPEDSIEAKINKLGKNLYEPQWLPLTQLPEVPFVSERLKAALVEAFATGFPEQPRELTDVTLNNKKEA